MRLDKDSCFFSFSAANRPALRVCAPCALTMECRDAFNGQITREDQPVDDYDPHQVNPATGPVYVDGAEPGDALCVSVRAIRLERMGFAMTIPGSGLLPDSVQGRIVMCPVRENSFIFKGVELPGNPMIGVIGTAPAGAPVPNDTPGDHGGNMDTATIGPGCRLYLPVRVPGALFGLGDLHAAMGDGEASTGLEVEGEVDLELRLEKGLTLPCPLLEAAGELAFVASAQTTDEALQLSARHMADLLTRTSALDADEALMLMSLCGNARISQVVDPLKTARFCMPLQVLEKFAPTLPR